MTENNKIEFIIKDFSNIQETGSPSYSSISMYDNGEIVLAGKTKRTDDEMPGGSYSLNLSPNDVWANGLDISTNSVIDLGARRINVNSPLQINNSIIPYTTTKITFNTTTYSVKTLPIVMLSPDFLIIPISDQWVGLNSLKGALSNIGSLPTGKIYKALGETKMELNTKTKQFIITSKINDFADNCYLFVNSELLPKAF